MAGPVLWSVPPVGTEGLMSLVTRTKVRNLLPSAHVLLRQVGAGHANNPTAALIPDLDEDRLAWILRQPVEEIAQRRHPPRAETGFVDFFGAAVRADEIVFRRRRFGPTALGVSPHARALWSLKRIPCCTEHWEYLIDACACGAVQRWQSADRLDRCDACNAPLATAPTIPVDAALRDGLGFLIGLLDPDRESRAAARDMLPPSLAQWDGGMVFELALTVMPLTEAGDTPNRGHLPAPGDVVRYATALAQAADIVRGWPASVESALIAAVERRATSKPNVRYKGLGHHLSGLISEVLPQIVRGAVIEAIAPLSAAAGETPPDQIGMRDAALLTGQEEHRLAEARRAGHLRTKACIRSNRLLPTLDRADIECLDDFLRHRLGPERASHRLHLPQYAIAQLAAANLLRVSDHPYVVTHYGTGQVHARDLMALQERLIERASSAGSIKDGIPLHRAARAIGGGMKPWAQILRILLDGKITYSMDGYSIDRIVVAHRDAMALRLIDLGTIQARPASHFSQRDAVEILNLPLKLAHLLPATPRPGGAHMIPWRRLRDIARDRITLAELSARTGIHGTRLETRLNEDGCPRLDGMGWMRRDALAVIARY